MPLTWTVIFAAIAATDPATQYAQTLQANLAKVAPGWVKGTGVVAVELGIGDDGAIRSLRLAHSSGKNKVDDAAQGLALDAEPFAAPDATLLGRNGEIDCVVRLAFNGGKRVDSAVACFAPDKIAAEPQGLGAGGDDAAFYLFTGWHKELAGDSAGAGDAYRRAVTLAPAWDLAGRALGLALVQAKRPSEGIPFLKLYVRSRAGAADAADYDRKIVAFEQQQAARLAEAKRPRQRLSKQDIVMGMRKGYALLEPCLKVARDKRALALRVDTLTLSWSIKKDGVVQAPHLEGPKNLLLTEHAECLESAMEAWRFPAYTEGSEISVKGVPIKVRGASPPPPPGAVTPPAATAATAAAPGGAPDAAAAAGAASPEVMDEPTFATCERTATEIGTYIRGHVGKVQDCVIAERQRDPKTTMPASLPMAFVVDVDGSVRGIRINHRYYRTGPLATCVADALTGTLPPVGGADCPAEFGLDISKVGQ